MQHKSHKDMALHATFASPTHPVSTCSQVHAAAAHAFQTSCCSCGANQACMHIQLAMLLFLWQHTRAAEAHHWQARHSNSIRPSQAIRCCCVPFQQQFQVALQQRSTVAASRWLYSKARSDRHAAESAEPRH